MGTQIKMHHVDELDKTRGAWRPCLTAGFVAIDGMPASWRRSVVMTCPRCGGHFGVGADPAGPKIDPVTGTTDDVVRCMIPVGEENKPCAWISEGPVTFDHFADAEGSDRFGKAEEKAKVENAAGRLASVRKRIQAQLEAELNEKALAEARKIIGNGDAPDAPEKLAAFLKSGGAIK